MAHPLGREPAQACEVTRSGLMRAVYVVGDFGEEGFLRRLDVE